MPKAIKTCRVCGNEYEACHTAKSSSVTFRWQDVACSPECGAIYLAEIRASRKGNAVNDAASISCDEHEEECACVAEPVQEDSKEEIKEEHYFSHNKKNKRFRK